MARRSEAEQVRAKLNRALKATVSDSIWKVLVSDGFVDDVITAGPEEEAFSDLLNRARYMRWEVSKRGRPKGLAAKVSTLLDPREVRRAESFSGLVARCARTDNATRSIRETYLADGRFLSKEEVDRFLGSVAPRYLSASSFAKLGIPVLRHESRFIDAKEPELQPTDWTAEIAVRIRWDGGLHDVPGASQLHFDAESNGISFSPFGRRAVRIQKSSVFDDMRKASSELGSNCNWTADKALRFILTDEAPSIPAVRFRETGIRRLEFAHLPLEFVIEPWVSPTTVLEVYRAVQRRYYGKQSQFLSERACALFDFVMERFTPEMTWPRACEVWNGQYRSKEDWQYTDYRNMRKDFMRVRWIIAFPGLNPPRRSRKRVTKGDTES